MYSKINFYDMVIFWKISLYQIKRGKDILIMKLNGKFSSTHQHSCTGQYKHTQTTAFVIELEY